MYTDTHICILINLLLNCRSGTHSLELGRLRSEPLRRLDARGTEKVGLVIGLIGLSMACHGGLQGILNGLTKSNDYPSKQPHKA